MDLVVSRLVANRDKDREFCAEVILRGIVPTDAVIERIAALDHPDAERAVLRDRATALVP